jgi:hypothetical protein
MLSPKHGDIESRVTLQSKCFVLAGRGWGKRLMSAIVKQEMLPGDQRRVILTQRLEQPMI